MNTGMLARWLLSGEWRNHPVRTLLAIGAIALGVALGFAIHLINAAAFQEFSAAARSLSGQSDLQVRAAQPRFDEAVYALVAAQEGVAIASPVLELDAAVVGAGNASAGHEQTLTILGLDVFRAAALSPDLTGVAPEGRHFDTLADDAIFLSPAAMQWLQVDAGQYLRLRTQRGIVELRVAGSITRARPGQRLAVMDIGAAQWRFDRLGELSRIDLQLQPGVDRTRFRADLQQALQARGWQMLLTESSDQEQRTANMSRAYRVNLNVLALVALFTGAFLVFSAQALSVIRRRQQFALLRVIGLTRSRLLRQVLLEGGTLGIIGALLGLALGYGMAAIALRLFGGDLGGGYFPGVQPSVRFAPIAASVFFLAGVAVALLGSAAPAWQAARTQLAPALKSGSEDESLSALATPWPALLAIVLGALMTQLPPVAGLPLFGYLAVALLLVGGIALMPWLAALVFRVLARFARGAVATLATARLANAPNQAAIALGGVLASFSLMVAMAIMVASFRVSVDDWLLHLLPADLYVQSAEGDADLLDPQEQQSIASTDGVTRAEFLRILPLTLAPDRPPVALLARAIDARDPGRSLPLTGDAIEPAQLPRATIPIWVSEAMVDLYGYRVGQRVRLPLQTLPSIAAPDHVVAGVWRDYARQSGAIAMQLADYRRLSGDSLVNDAALWLQAGSDPADVAKALRDLPFGAALEIEAPGEIRTRSLKIFDRSFAITYLLEAVAIVIGLFGIASTFSAQTLARVKEFGVLRHIGVSRQQILTVLALEGMLLAGIGVVAGFALGWCISLILVFIVNPQSFHWTMQMHMPWGLLATVAAVLLGASGLTALGAGRLAVSGDAVRAVREDW